MRMNTYTILNLHTKKKSEVRAANIDNLRYRLIKDNESKRHVDLHVFINGRSIGIFQGPYREDTGKWEFVWRKANGDVTGIKPDGRIPPTR